jgi:hypothetical protein
MRKRCDRLSLPLEASDHCRVRGQIRRQDLKRYLTIQPRIPGPVDFPHTARA